jgi:hypothetical protein
MKAKNTQSGVAVLRTSGAILAYVCLAAFVMLISVQLYRWFREGEWTHIGITDGLRGMLSSCCVSDGSTGPLALFVRWLDAPTDWLGWHKLLEVIPASIGLFALSMLGNFLFIYATDRLQDQRRDPGTGPGTGSS